MVPYWKILLRNFQYCSPVMERTWCHRWFKCETKSSLGISGFVQHNSCLLLAQGCLVFWTSPLCSFCFSFTFPGSLLLGNIKQLETYKSKHQVFCFPMFHLNHLLQAPASPHNFFVKAPSWDLWRMPPSWKMPTKTHFGGASQVTSWWNCKCIYTTIGHMREK